MHLKKILACWLLGLGALALSFHARALVVLQYHHISDDTPKATSTPPDLFKAHLEYLANNDFKVIGLDALAKLVRADKQLPDKTAVITFDDGYLSVYENAYPLLEKYGFPFAVFINTEPHDAGNPHFMSWQQMRELAEAGVVFANHTVSHPHLIRRSEGESPEAWRRRVSEEIDKAESVIQKQLGQSHRLLAYPFGEYNAELQGLLADKGYLAFGQQSGPLAPYSDRQALPRFPFGGAYGGMEGFATKVNTLPMPLRDISVLSEDGRALIEPELPEGVVRPKLILQFHEKDALPVNCFASGQGAIPIATAKSAVSAQADRSLPVGRSRYNCTAASSQPGRYYWHSQLFIRRQPNGAWYRE